MLKKSLLVLAVLLVLPLLPASGQVAGEYLAGGPSCEDLKARCASLTAEEIFDLADIGTGNDPTAVGVCYVHTKEGCPNCACHSYIKQSWRQGQKGFDGGTGCIGGSTPEQSRAAAAQILKSMCESGACCCPVLEPQPCAFNFPVRARDPRTGSCCTFPNPCTMPPDWEVSTASDPHCGQQF